MLFRYAILFSQVCFLFARMSLFAQYGTVDPTFNALDDGTFGDGPLRYHSGSNPPNGSLECIMELPDGKLLIAGDWATYNGVRTARLIRTFPNGLYDDSFNAELPPDHRPYASLMLNDGSYLVVASLSAGVGQSSSVIKRYSTEHVLDESFNAVANSYIDDIILLTDGRILISGTFYTVNGTQTGRVARLHPDGMLDPSFNVGNGPNAQVFCLLPMEDGSVLIGGRFSEVSGHPVRGVARLMENGMVDPLFNPMATAMDEYVSVNDLVLDTEGRIIAGGSFTLPGDPQQKNLMRFLSNGTLDGTFPIASGTSSSVNVLEKRPDGSILVGGLFSSVNAEPRSALALLLPDGALAPDFLPDLRHHYGPDVKGIAQTMNGDLVVWGRLNSIEGRNHIDMARLKNTGDRDPFFNPGRGVGGSSTGMVAMTDGRIAIGGDFVSYNDEPRPYLAFLTSDGDLHPTFNGGSGPNAPVDLIIPLPGDRLFIAGGFTNYNGVPTPRVAVVDAFGALVEGFSFPNEVVPNSHRPSAALALDDGSILLATVPSSQPHNWVGTLRRFQPNGTLDPSFQPPSPMYGGIYAMLEQPDGRILIGGSIHPGSTSAPRGLARLMPNGSIDPSFSIGTGIGPSSSSGVADIVLTPDGRIIIVGWFSVFRNANAACIACMDPNGTPCQDFSTQGAFSAGFYSSLISTIALLPDGRMVLGGYFQNYDGWETSGMAVALPNGVADPTFGIGSGPDYVPVAWIRQVLVDADGHYLIHGMFHSINGVTRHRIARILGGGGVGVEERSAKGEVIKLWPNPVSESLYTTKPITGTIHDAQGRLVLSFHQRSTIDVTALTSGAYSLRTVDGTALHFMKQ